MKPTEIWALCNRRPYLTWFSQRKTFSWRLEHLTSVSFPWILDAKLRQNQTWEPSTQPSLETLNSDSRPWILNDCLTASLASFSPIWRGWSRHCSFWIRSWPVLMAGEKVRGLLVTCLVKTSESFLVYRIFNLKLYWKTTVWNSPNTHTWFKTPRSRNC